VHRPRPVDTAWVAGLGFVAFVIAAFAVVGRVALTVTSWITDRFQFTARSAFELGASAAE
jgi:hypothetical protein